MKIAIMAAWNTTSGVAMHSEPIGKAFVEMGHEVIVFTFYKDDFHGEGFTANDEDFVIRCFGTRPHTNRLDPRPFIDNDYDILLVEDLGMLPVDKLADIAQVLKRKAKLIHVVHENRPPEHTWFYKIKWDKIVYFDSRQDFLKKVYQDAIYIPFPSYKIREGNKIEARKKLNLPLDKKIVYSFAYRGYRPYYRNLPEELRDDTVLLHVIRKDEQEMLEETTDSKWFLVRREDVITTEKFDDYLFASDAVIFHKFENREHAVISTTVYQSLGTGCPIFVPKNSDYFDNFEDEVIHYRNTADLDEKLVELLRNENKQKELKEQAHKFVEATAPEKIAQMFIDLFKELIQA